MTPEREQRLAQLGYLYEPDLYLWRHRRLGWRLRRAAQMADADPTVAEALHDATTWTRGSHAVDALTRLQRENVEHFGLAHHPATGRWTPSWYLDLPKSSFPIDRWFVFTTVALLIPAPFFTTRQLGDPDLMYRELSRYFRLCRVLSVVVLALLAWVLLQMLWFGFGWWFAGWRTWAGVNVVLLLLQAPARFGPKLWWPMWAPFPGHASLGGAWDRALATAGPIEAPEGLYLHRVDRTIATERLLELDPSGVEAVLQAIRMPDG